MLYDGYMMLCHGLKTQESLQCFTGPRLEELTIATAHVQHALHGATQQGIDDELLTSTGTNLEISTGTDQ